MTPGDTYALTVGQQCADGVVAGVLAPVLPHVTDVVGSCKPVVVTREPVPSLYYCTHCRLTDCTYCCCTAAFRGHLSLQSVAKDHRLSLQGIRSFHLHGSTQLFWLAPASSTGVALTYSVPLYSNQAWRRCFGRLRRHFWGVLAATAASFERYDCKFVISFTVLSP